MTKRAQKCPIARIATLLSDPWTMLVIRDLLSAPRRFSELERSLSGVSSRTLTAKLKNLSDEKVATKSGLLYSITPRGKKLGKVIKAMEECGKEYV